MQNTACFLTQEPHALLFTSTSLWLDSLLLVYVGMYPANRCCCCFQERQHCVDSWKAHEAEAWSCAFDHWQVSAATPACLLPHLL